MPEYFKVHQSREVAHEALNKHARVLIRTENPVFLPVVPIHSVFKDCYGKRVRNKAALGQYLLEVLTLKVRTSYVILPGIYPVYSFSYTVYSNTIWPFYLWFVKKYFDLGTVEVRSAY